MWFHLIFSGSINQRIAKVKKKSAKIWNITYLTSESTYEADILPLCSTNGHYKVENLELPNSPVFVMIFFSVQIFCLCKMSKFLFFSKKAKFDAVAMSVVSRTAKNGFCASKYVYKPDLRALKMMFCIDFESKWGFSKRTPQKNVALFQKIK